MTGQPRFRKLVLSSTIDLSITIGEGDATLIPVREPALALVFALAALEITISAQNTNYWGRLKGQVLKKGGATQFVAKATVKVRNEITG